MEFKEGIYENIPFTEYRAIEAYSSHDLMTVDRCPYTWKNKKELVETPALLEGRVQHNVFLEHHNFNQEFVIQPDINRRTKAGKEEYAEFIAGIGNLTPITHEMYDTCMERREVVNDYIPQADHSVELTICYTFNEQPFKSRLDWHDGTYAWDLKTCRDASPNGFKRAINMFRYHMQAALYLYACRASGLKTDGFYFLAQEKQHPYPYGVYTLSDEALKYAEAKNEQALNTLLIAEKNNDFKPFNVMGTQTIELGDLW